MSLPLKDLAILETGDILVRRKRVGSTNEISGWAFLLKNMGVEDLKDLYSRLEGKVELPSEVTVKWRVPCYTDSPRIMSLLPPDVVRHTSPWEEEEETVLLTTQENPFEPSPLLLDFIKEKREQRKAKREEIERKKEEVGNRIISAITEVIKDYPHLTLSQEDSLQYMNILVNVAGVEVGSISATNFARKTLPSLWEEYRQYR